MIGTIFLTAAALIAAALYAFICDFARQYNALESCCFEPLFDPTPAPADAEELPLDAAFLRQLSELDPPNGDDVAPE